MRVLGLKNFVFVPAVGADEGHLAAHAQAVRAAGVDCGNGTSVGVNILLRGLLVMTIHDPEANSE
mgnify:CR=1 FL=1